MFSNTGIKRLVGPMGTARMYECLAIPQSHTVEVLRSSFGMDEETAWNVTWAADAHVHQEQSPADTERAERSQAGRDIEQHAYLDAMASLREAAVCDRRIAGAAIACSAAVDAGLLTDVKRARCILERAFRLPASLAERLSVAVVNDSGRADFIDAWVAGSDQ